MPRIGDVHEETGAVFVSLDGSSLLYKLPSGQIVPREDLEAHDDNDELESADELEEAVEEEEEASGPEESEEE